MLHRPLNVSAKTKVIDVPMQVIKQMAQRLACLKRSASLVSGQAEKVELEAMSPARVLITLDKHFQAWKCRGKRQTVYRIGTKSSRTLTNYSTPCLAVIQYKRHLFVTRKVRCITVNFWPAGHYRIDFCGMMSRQYGKLYQLIRARLVPKLHRAAVCFI